MHRPLLAIAMGDPTGIGPEVIAGSWSDARLHQAASLVVVGRPEVMRRATELRQSSARVIAVESVQQVVSDARTLPCLVAGSPDCVDAPPATIDARGGQAAYDCLVVATDLAISGKTDGVVTGPLNKAALWKAGHHFPGHTEVLAERCGVSDFAMMLYLERLGAPDEARSLGVAHVTLHMPLRDVFSHLNTERVLSTTRLLANALHKLQGRPPRIGVCALNPHAGETGLFGDEEARIIEPAIRALAGEGMIVSGPYPADTLFALASQGRFDGVVAMYHDQGHIAVKLLGMHRAVNITLGLPIVRTSVAHGTAFDLAWQGVAETSSLKEAILVAARLARNAQPTSVPAASQTGD